MERVKEFFRSLCPESSFLPQVGDLEKGLLCVDAE